MIFSDECLCLECLCRSSFMRSPPQRIKQYIIRIRAYFARTGVDFLKKVLGITPSVLKAFGTLSGCLSFLVEKSHD
jgi:hypothetical protein